MSKKSYSENQAIVEKFWKQYQKDNNPKWLAEICLNVPFFDHPEVGEELARLIKKDCPIKDFFGFYESDPNKCLGCIKYTIRPSMSDIVSSAVQRPCISL